MTAIATTRSPFAKLLLIGASSLALAMPAAANDVIFSSTGDEPQAGQRTIQTEGVTQIALTRGGTVSISQAAEYTLNADGSIDLHRGSITVVGADGANVIIRMPKGLQASVAGESSASFSVANDGEASGHTMTGEVMVGQTGRAQRSFRDATMWKARPGRGPRMAIANPAVSQPSTNPVAAPNQVIAISGDAGPVAAALNGIPVTLGENLAGAGASADIVAAATRVEVAAQNPVLETFPTGDLAALVSAAVELETLYGGRPFNAAQADIIRTYLRFLASGASGADFLSAYGAFLTQYLDLIRDGGVPSNFESGVADVVTINAYLNFIARSGAIANLSADDRQLVEDYLAFLADGGSPDEFAATLNFPDFAGFTASLTAYADFLENGGLPSDYDAQDIADLQAFYSALVQAGQANDRLAGDFDLLSAYFTFLGSGGAVDGFAGLPIYADYATALSAYAQFLAAGNLPSDYTALDITVLDAYLAALAALPGGAVGFDAIAADQAALLKAYFAFLGSGGTIDGFAGLPIYADYAGALSAYAEFLAAGNLPSDYAALDIATLQAYLAALAALPVNLTDFDGLDGDEAMLLNAYFAFLAGGGDVDGFAALPIYLDYIAALNAYFAFLSNGGLPSEYTELDLAVIEAYLAALDALDGGLGGFDDLADFFEDYFAFVEGGGNPNQFPGLPGASSPVLNNAVLALVSRNGFDNRTGVTAEIEPDGQITAVTGSDTVRTDYTAAGDTLRERGRIGDIVAWTRYERGASAGGVTNFNTHLVVGQPAFDLPASGLVLYDLIGGTEPTDAFGEEGSTGFFTGQLGVAFGASPTIGMNFDIYAGSRGWNASTNGGADNAASGGISIDADNTFSLGLLTTGITDNACLDGCSTTVTGGLFGDDASHVGLTYFLQDSPGSVGQSLVNGVAIFGTEGTAIDGLGTRPDTGGGTGTDPFGPGGPTLTYTGGFNGNGTGLFVQATAQPSGNDPFLIRELIQGTALDAILDNDGGLDRYRTNVGTTYNRFDRGTAKVEDISGNADVLIGRWTDGEYKQQSTSASQPQTYLLSANQGFHYMLSDGFVGAAAFPVGRIEYDLLAATRPTTFDGSLAPGTFTADAAIIFGSAPAIAIEGQIAFDGLAYTFATPGGVAGDGRPLTISGQAGSTPGGYFGFRVDGTTDDGRSGPIFFDARMSDAQGSSFGTVYRAEISNPTTGADFNALLGAAIFGAVDTGGGGNGGGSGGTGFTGTRSNQVYYAYLDGSLNTGFGGSADFVDGEITGLSSIIGTVTNNDASIVEATDLEEIAWARWTGGTVQSSGLFGDVDYPVGANGGYHVMTGEATTTLPGGTIAYELIGGTSATDNQGSAPGTVTGDLAIAFGSTSLVGYDLSMAVGGRSWAVSTPGGAANPAASNINLVIGSGVWTFGGTFTSTSNTVTAGGNACSATCIVNIGGVLYGDNAAYAGVAFNVTDASNSATVGASGLAIFGQEGGTASAIAPSIMAAPTASVGDWSRWSGTQSTTTDVFEEGRGGIVGSAMSATLADPSSSHLDADALADGQRAVAIERAQQMFGGSITWPSDLGR